MGGGGGGLVSVPARTSALGSQEGYKGSQGIVDQHPADILRALVRGACVPRPVQSRGSGGKAMFDALPWQPSSSRLVPRSAKRSNCPPGADGAIHPPPSFFPPQLPPPLAALLSHP